MIKKLMQDTIPSGRMVEKFDITVPVNLEQLKKFLTENDLLYEPVEVCYCAFENGNIIACGCRDKNVLKCFAVAENHRGENLLDEIIGNLITEFDVDGHGLLFVFTKRENKKFFTGYKFVELAHGNTSCLLERCDYYAIEERLHTIALHYIRKGSLQLDKKIGAVVINANPFTLGHRYLIETAAREVDTLMVFVVQENKSEFSFDERMTLVLQNTADLQNIIVLPSTPYLISNATFPSYFLKDKALVNKEHAIIDAEIFGRYFVPPFNISIRFVGDEPIDKSTRLYNEVLAAVLPKHNCALHIIKRLNIEGTDNCVSASLVRKYAKEKNFEALAQLVSPLTLKFLKEKYR